MKNLKTLIIGLFIFFNLQSIGQGWEQYINIPNVDPNPVLFMSPNSFAGELTVEKKSNNDYLVAPVSGYFDSFMTIDTGGNYTWFNIDSLPFSGEKHLIPTHDNHYISAASRNGTTADDFSLSKINAVGDTLWLINKNNLSSHTVFFLGDLIQTQDNNIVAFLYEENTPAPINFRLIKFDYNTGNILWDKTIAYNTVVPNIGVYLYNDHFDLIEYANGDLVFSTGQWIGAGSTLDYDIILVKTDSGGNILTSNTYNYPDAQQAVYANLDINTNGDLALVVIKDGHDDPLLIKMDNQLNEIWRTAIWNSGLIGDVGDVSINDDGSIVVVGGLNGQRAIRKFDSAGNTLWTKQHENYNNTVTAQTLYASYQAIETVDDGGYLLFSAINDNFPQSEIYIIRIDGNGNIYNSAFDGYIYIDDNLNCSLDANEDTLNVNVLLRTVQGADTSYHITNSDGYYNININSGTYELSAIPLGQNWESCTAQTINVILNDTVGVNTALQPQINCSDLVVSITTPVLIRCFSNTYVVNYSNIGTQDEVGAYIEVELDLFLTVDSSSIPYTQNGQIYTFLIGDLDIGESGSFTIDATVSCNAVLGQTHCVNATIYPNQICLPNNMTWNGANIIVNAECVQNDSIRFTIENIGAGDMTQARNYYVIEDQVLPLHGAYQLQSGQDTSWTMPANLGSIYFLQVEQEVTHPFGNNTPTAVSFNCNTISINANLINQFGLGDAFNFQDVDCQQNVGSFDPNDKTGFPTGYGTDNYITKNDKIEYLIRFQNTGTYTAFNVRVEDEIDISTLDLSTLQMQGSSHNYELAIEDGNKLVFYFNNIMLPDSNANEPASHGFIRFKISQKANNAIGTIIENDAAIYFDFNAPIITNTTFHTVGENFIQVVSTLPTKEKLATVNVFPNPFSQQATFEIETERSYQNMNLVIYNLMGQTIKTISSNGNNRIILDRENLTSGVYFYQIQSEGLVLDSGKLMIR